ncbi:MAG: hypothetical protein Kow0032_13730 [Methyloligellaceae bacterium]
MRFFHIAPGLICLGASIALAAPVTHDKRQMIEAQWLAASGERCDAVCARQGAEPENMLVYSSDGGDIYLCRVRKPPANRFGTNYEDVCKVEDPYSERSTSLEQHYECLCVWRVPAGR